MKGWEQGKEMGQKSPGEGRHLQERRWCEQRVGWGLHGDRPTRVGQGEPSGGEVGNGFGKEAINNQFLISFLLIQNDNYISFHTKMKY